MSLWVKWGFISEQESFVFFRSIFASKFSKIRKSKFIFVYLNNCCSEDILGSCGLFNESWEKTLPILAFLVEVRWKLSFLSKLLFVHSKFSSEKIKFMWKFLLFFKTSYLRNYLKFCFHWLTLRFTLFSFNLMHQL